MSTGARIQTVRFPVDPGDQGDPDCSENFQTVQNFCAKTFQRRNKFLVGNIEARAKILSYDRAHLLLLGRPARDSSLPTPYSNLPDLKNPPQIILQSDQRAYSNPSPKSYPISQFQKDNIKPLPSLHIPISPISIILPKSYSQSFPNHITIRPRHSLPFSYSNLSSQSANFTFQSGQFEKDNINLHIPIFIYWNSMGPTGPDF